MRRTMAVGVSMVIVMAACGSPSGTTADDTISSVPVDTVAPVDTQPSDNGADTTMTDETPASTPADDYVGPLADIVALAVADLASEQGVVASRIVVVSAEAVVWPDGSLGCPIPGMRYTQVQTDGTRIVLALDDTLYIYHSGDGRDPFLCVPTNAKNDPGPQHELTIPTDE